MILRVAAVLGVVAALVLGCSGPSVMDNDRLQQLIGDWLESNAQVTANITCPQNEPIKQDDVFTCTAVTQDGLTLVVQVTQTDDKGDVDLELTGAS